MEGLQLQYIIGSVESFDALSALIVDAETGEKKLLRLSERKAVDMLSASQQSGEPWFFAHSPDMVLMICGPAELLEGLELPAQ
jgi:hypothetical protein